MPVTFEVAKDWKPKPVSADSAAALGPLATRGPLTVVCEVDAKPAGVIGFLQVWTGKPGSDDANRIAKDFIAADPSILKSEFREVKANQFDAVEVSYTTHSKLLDEDREERALVVVTPQGPVLLRLGGLDSEEHTQMLPALFLARDTLKPGE